MIVIEPYNPNWINEFESIKSDLSKTLENLASRIDHIGSTSVPGLGAKDVIDIQITVHKLTPKISRKLIDAGYVHIERITHDHVPRGEDDSPNLWEKMIFNESAGQRRANIHVRVQGNPNQKYPILFRDYLRAHPKSAQSIELIKRQLAKYHADDVEAYYDIKDPVYDLIWDAALDWSTYTNWKLE